VVAGGHRRVELLRAKARRGRQDHQVHVRVHHARVSVHADEAALGRHVHTVRMFLRDALKASAEPVLEGVGHGGEPGVRAGVERLDRGAGAASAAADQADPYGPRPAGVRPGLQSGGQRRHRCGGHRTAQELSA